MAETAMQYRRFGKTELQMPVLTCGSMRFMQSWQEFGPAELDAQNQANLEACVRRAVEAGMNHIETARGYGSSEFQLGLVLSSLPRDQIMVQTKIGPRAREDEFLRAFDTSLANLRLDYVDLLAVHGINTEELLDQTLRGGSLSACRKLQDRGLVRHVGFSSHGWPQPVIATIESGEFSYVNLHWYYFDQRNRPAVVAAHENDMGVLIISPNDKGGRLSEPPRKLVELCDPLTPMGFNDLFCLSHDEVHTLNIGAARPTDHDAHLAILPMLADAGQVVAPIVERLQGELTRCFDEEWASHWHEGLPLAADVPGNVPLYHVLRLYNCAKAFDMVDYARMRYNILGGADHWFPGNKVDRIDWQSLPKCLSGYRFADRVPDYLREAHELLNDEGQKRLSQTSN